MLQSKEIFEDGTIIGFWQVDETEEELLLLLDHKKRWLQQLQNFKIEKRRLEFLAVRVLLKHLLDDEKYIDYQTDGAPYLTDHSYNISITHTGIYVGIIMHPSKQVGIDIERINDKVVRVKSKYLSEDEQNFVERNNAKVHLTLMWCAKEAVYKIVGKEAVDIVEKITISPFIPYIEGTIEAQENCTKERAKFLLNYRVEPEVCKVWTVK
ncbi:MAG: 4'-phosphopantetheinyl transferase superfamily protein [Porphyromonadaceae bacterium]|nr:4'-phosphopantetheinyl transferase superfamily protein [Porphyromonadaceae bacterium]